MRSNATGFFLRQWKRNGGQGAWSFLVQAKWVFVCFAGAFVAIPSIAVRTFV